MAKKTIGRSGTEIIQSIRPGYTIFFEQERMLIRFVDQGRNPLYFRGTCPDNKYYAPFIRNEDDFRRFVLFLAYIEGLEAETCESIGKQPAFTFRCRPAQAKAKERR